MYQENSILGGPFSRCQDSLFSRGLPLGRVVLSRERRAAVLLIHLSPPKGVPLTMLFRTAASSSSVLWFIHQRPPVSW